MGAIYWHTLYDIKVRSNIIGQTFDPIADSIYDLDISKFTIYNLENYVLDDSFNIMRQIEFLYTDQQIQCRNYFNTSFSPDDKNTYYIFGYGPIPTIAGVNFRSDLLIFICYLKAINSGTAAGIISRLTLALFDQITHN